MLSRITDFEIKRLDMDNLPDELYTFADTCAEQGMQNNISVAAMKIGKWGNEAWWCTWADGKIISISGCHQMDQYEKGCWRLMVRTATLLEYRGRAPGSIRTIRTDFNWGHVLPYQVNYAVLQGATKVVFTTNSDSDGDKNSLRTNRVVRKVLEPQGLVKLDAQDVEIFYTRQNVWEIIIS